MSRRKLSAPQGGGTDAAVSTTAGPMLAVWGLKSQQMRSQRSKIPKIFHASLDGLQLRSLCIDILACHDETIHAVTVIRLNLNPPFQKSTG